MEKFRLLLLYWLLASPIMLAQHSLRGTVRDQASGEALPYVNVGVVDRNMGTVTAADGTFSLQIAAGMDQETVKVSMVGYKPLSLKVADFVERLALNPVLQLERNVSALREVVIKKKRRKTGILGNVPARKPESAGFEKNILGNELGVPIHLKRAPTYLRTFHAMVDYNHYEVFRFRLNFYRLENGLPGENLLDENIIVSSTLRKGQLDVDLTPYNLWVDGDFFVSIELIENLGEGGLHFQADFKGTPVITRAASQGRWNRRSDGLSFGFWVTAAY